MLPRCSEAPNLAELSRQHQTTVEGMLDQENSLNSSCSETTARILNPAGPGQTIQLVALPCQPSHGIAMAYETDGHRQPRLTKALLDQHEKAALTSLLLMQSTAMKVSPTLPQSCSPQATCHPMLSLRAVLSLSDTVRPSMLPHWLLYASLSRDTASMSST